LLLKPAIWFTISLALSCIFFREFWANLGTMLSPDWIFSQHHAAPWGVLGLCCLGLWLKREAVWQEMKIRQNSAFIPLGLALIAGAVFIPSSQDFLVLQVLLASLGVFVTIFGKAAKIPAILISIYSFAISFPLLIERFAGLPYSMSAIKPLTWIFSGLGYQFENQGQWMHFTSYSGEPISVAITAACAGPVTMGVFLTIFTLMMLDLPVPPKKATWLFLFGAVGTWLQSVIRLVILMFIGYHWGREAMLTAHFWTIYILFPLWYLLFAYIYFRQVERPPQLKNESGADFIQVTEN